MRIRFSTVDGSQEVLTNSWEATKKIAVEIARNPTDLEILKRWWTNKYKLPSNHELFTSQTKFELLVEYQLDIFEKNPLEVHRQADGEIQFTNTGDSLIDKWEQDLADGIMPDLTEAFNEESLEKLKRTFKKLGKDPTVPKTFADTIKQNELLERIEQKAREQGLFNPNNYTKTF